MSEELLKGKLLKPESFDSIQKSLEVNHSEPHTFRFFVDYDDVNHRTVAKMTRELIRRWNNFTQLQHQLAAAQQALREAREEFQRIWEDDDMGWITTDGQTEIECGGCGASNAEGDKSKIQHDDWCVQGRIFKRLAAIDEMLPPNASPAPPHQPPAASG